jgi:hypothetical protein
MNFNDLSRFMDDFFYLAQRGGRFAKLLGGAQEGHTTFHKILYAVLLVVLILTIIVVLWILYYLLFRGYPRFLVDLGTFHFYHKEKLDLIVRDGDMLIQSLKFLISPNPSCMNPYSTYQLLYQPTNLSSLLTNFDKNKSTYYKTYKYDEQYHQLFREYYLYFNKVDRKTTAEIWNKDNKIIVEYVNFYQQLLTYKLSKGEISTVNTEKGGSKSDDELLFELYKNERTNNFISHKRVLTLKNTLQSIAKEIKDVMTQVIKQPIVPYIIVPDNTTIINGVLKDWSQYAQKIKDKTIHQLPYKQLSDYSWYVIEYTSGQSFNDLVQQIPPYTKDQESKIVYYLNLSRNEKDTAEKRILNKVNQTLLEFIKKHPIFSHIHFSRKIQSLEKPTLYANLVKSYNILGGCTPNDTLQKQLTNLQQNAFAFKRFVTSVAYLHLFLNVYQKDMTFMYEKQNISKKDFWTELWQPYMTDIIVNRVGNYAKRVFGSTSMSRSYKNFSTWYKQLGKDINRTIKQVFKAFFTSVPIEKPEMVDTDDPQNVAATSSTTPQI